MSKTLQHWKQDADPAPGRDADTLEQLPEAERKDWRALWAEVEAMLAGRKATKELPTELFARP